MRKTRKKIPAWAVGYLVTGDNIGLEADEIALVDNWRDSWNVRIVFPAKGGKRRFSWHPEFGRPCEVVDCDILYEL